MRLRRVFEALRIIISLGLVLFLVWRADPAKIWESWEELDWRLFIFAILLQFLGIAISAGKWGVILKASGYQQPYSWLLKMYLVGQFANNFLPTTIGGDAIRVSRLAPRIGSISRASASVFFERLTGFVALSTLGNLAIVWAYFDNSGTPLITEDWLRWLTVGVSIAAIGAMIASFTAPTLLRIFGPYLPAIARRPMQKIANALAECYPKGRNMVIVLLMSFIFQITWIVIHWVSGMALGIDTIPVVYAFIAPITDIVGLAPIFVNNFGARDVVFTLYLGQVGVPAATAIALSFTIFTVRLVPSMVGGLVVLFGGVDLTTTPSTPTTPDTTKELATDQ